MDRQAEGPRDSIAVSWIRERLSSFIFANNGPPLTLILNAWMSFFSETVITMQYACWIWSAILEREPLRFAESVAPRSASRSCPLS